MWKILKFLATPFLLLAAIAGKKTSVASSGKSWFSDLNPTFLRVLTSVVVAAFFWWLWGVWASGVIMGFLFFLAYRRGGFLVALTLLGFFLLGYFYSLGMKNTCGKLAHGEFQEVWDSIASSDSAGNPTEAVQIIPPSWGSATIDPDKAVSITADPGRTFIHPNGHVRYYLLSNPEVFFEENPPKGIVVKEWPRDKRFRGAWGIINKSNFPVFVEWGR